MWVRGNAVSVSTVMLVTRSVSEGPGNEDCSPSSPREEVKKGGRKSSLSQRSSWYAKKDMICTYQITDSHAEKH